MLDQFCFQGMDDGLGGVAVIDEYRAIVTVVDILMPTDAAVAQGMLQGPDGWLQMRIRFVCEPGSQQNVLAVAYVGALVIDD